MLWTIAANYQDLVDPTASAGIQGDGNTFGLQLTPATYTSTVREFERLMTTMRNDRHRALITLTSGERVSVRKLHWHLLEYHLKAVRTTRAPKLTIARGHARKLHKLQVDQHGAPLPQFRVHRHPQARIELAVAATEWQADNWGLSHEPMLPSAMTEPMLVAA